MSPLAPKPRKRRSFNTRPRLATTSGSQGSSAVRTKPLEPADANMSNTSGPTPLSHGNSSDTEADSTSPERHDPYRLRTATRSPLVPTSHPDPDGLTPPPTEMSDLFVNFDQLESPSAPATVTAPPPPPATTPARPSNSSTQSSSRSASAGNVPRVTSASTAPASSGPKRYPPVLSLNAKRKFFHLLAILLFVPGFVLDVRN